MSKPCSNQQWKITVFVWHVEIRIRVDVLLDYPYVVAFYREKNRLSYTHDGGVRIDLTQVKVPGTNGSEVRACVHHT